MKKLVLMRPFKKSKKALCDATPNEYMIVWSRISKELDIEINKDDLMLDALKKVADKLENAPASGLGSGLRTRKL